jgi:hypothetical protein
MQIVCPNRSTAHRLYGWHKHHDLNEAVAPLKAFRSTWNPGDVIDEESGVTADDIDTILSFMADFPSSD